MIHQAVAEDEGKKPDIPLETTADFGTQDTSTQKEFNYEDFYNGANR